MALVMFSAAYSASALTVHECVLISLMGDTTNVGEYDRKRSHLGSHSKERVVLVGSDEEEVPASLSF